MKAEKLPSGRWRVRVYLGIEDGKRKYRSVTANTKPEALREAALVDPNPTEDLTVEEAVLRYMRIKEPVISPSTLHGYQKIYTARIKTHQIRLVKLSRLKAPVVQEWVSWMAREVAPKTVRNNYGFMTAVLAMFAPDLRLTSVRLPQRKPAEVHMPTTEDVNAVLAVADPVLRVAILLGATAMMRRGEICALTADDVDRDACRISITKAMVRTKDGDYVIKSQKTPSSFRSILVNPELIALLPLSGQIVPMKTDDLTRAFEKAVKKAGVIPFRFHDLRHYAASMAVSSAINAGSLSVQGRGGWATDRVMKSVYTHPVEADADDRKIIQFYSKAIRWV